MDLTGKSAVITGSGRGIGRGIALALAQQGCNIAINYFRNRAPAEQTAAMIAELGVKAVVIKVNVGDADGAQKLVQRAAEHFGGVDIFVGNAASGVMRPITEIEPKAWDWTFDINARSILLGAQTAAPYMKARGWGRILTISSMGSRRVIPSYGVVGVSKAAVESMTRYLAVELAPHNITVNCISPGMVITDALDHFDEKDALIAHARNYTPAGRLVTVQDIGRLALWLCSEDAAMIVGQTIEIDGGYNLLAPMQG